MMVQTLARSFNNVNSVRYNAEYYAHLTLGDDQLNNFPRKLPDPIHVMYKQMFDKKVAFRLLLLDFYTGNGIRSNMTTLWPTYCNYIPSQSTPKNIVMVADDPTLRELRKLRCPNHGI
jgi:hypothetical protein